MSLNDVSSRPLAKLAPRAVASHKGDYGRVLIIGGSRGMAGAPALAGRAALRSGAGLVTLAVPRSIQSIVASFEPSYMTVGFGKETDDELQAKGSAGIDAAAEKMTAVALGPGLGTAPSTSSLVDSLYSTIEQPMVVDADGLNALVRNRKRLRTPAGPRILTPHAGEYQRLSGEACAEELTKRAEQAAALCTQAAERSLF